MLFNESRELRAATPFGTFPDHQGAPARLHDVRSRRDALDALVVSEVQRITGGRGDHRVHRFRYFLKQSTRYELDSLPVSLHRISREYAGDLPIARQRNIHHKP